MVTPKPELNAGPDEPTPQSITIVEEEITVEAPQEMNLTVSGIEVTELKTKSVLTWDSLLDATEYNIYKKTGETTITLIDKVSEPRYEIEIT